MYLALFVRILDGAEDRRRIVSPQADQADVRLILKLDQSRGRLVLGGLEIHIIIKGIK